MMVNVVVNVVVNRRTSCSTDCRNLSSVDLGVDVPIQIGDDVSARVVENDFCHRFRNSMLPRAELSQCLDRVELRWVRFKRLPYKSEVRLEQIFPMRPSLYQYFQYRRLAA